MRQQVNIAGVNIDNLSLSEVLSRVDLLVRARVPSYIITPNVDHIVKWQKDDEFKEIYDRAALVLADGVPLLWAGHFLGTPIVEKVSGSDLLPQICEQSASKGYRLFFLGGRPGAADLAAKKLCQKFPGLQIAGTYCPPYGFEKDQKENDKIIGLIRAAKPDILFVGLGAPKQEKWIYRFYQVYQAPVSIGIGVTFEYISGMVRRAPVWMQKAGMEWSWRILMEPGRLWKRYLIDDMQFFPLILSQKLGKKSLSPARVMSRIE